MTLRRWAIAGAVCLTLISCNGGNDRIDPVDYDSFYLWAGVRPQPALDRATTIYILDGEVRRGGMDRLEPLRPAVPHVRNAEVWLVVRAARLDWGEGVWRDVLGDLDRWQSGGNRLAGLQVDFDASTRGIVKYARFLAEVRARLSRRYRLSVTGLMDWGANGDPAALGKLTGVIDEVVVQTYQGRTTIPGSSAYIDRLARLPIQHKLALMQGGIWHAPPALARDPGFAGYVVFLRNPPL